MSRSRDSGQIEPTAALVVLLAVCVAVTTYATAIGGPEPVRDRDRDLATPTLDRVVEATATGGVVDPGRTPRARRAGPAGYRLNVTVAAGGRRWRAGPTPPRSGTDVAARRIGVDLGLGRVAPGRVRVEVWA
jgi:hypothetical protein